MARQQAISARRLKRKVGKTLTVLIDEVGESGAIGRSSADAPEIDGRVLVTDGGALKPGDWAEVKIAKADAHDLVGRLATPAKRARRT